MILPPKALPGPLGSGRGQRLVKLATTTVHTHNAPFPGE